MRRRLYPIRFFFLGMGGAGLFVATLYWVFLNGYWTIQTTVPILGLVVYVWLVQPPIRLALWLAWSALRGQVVEILVDDNFYGGDASIAVPKRGRR